MVFKDRAACLAGDFLLPLSSLLPRRLLLPGRVSASISVRRLLSSCCFRRPAGFRSLQRRPVASADFLQRGAASTAWPPSLSTAASLTPSTRPPFLPGFFVGARLLPPPRLLSTRCVDCRIPYFLTDPLKADPRQCAGFFVRFRASTTTAPGINFLSRALYSCCCSVEVLGSATRPEGRGFYHRRVQGQQSSSTLLFCCQLPARICVGRGAASIPATRDLSTTVPFAPTHS